MITSTANGKVKRLINLKKKRKLRDEEHVFLVEASGCSGKCRWMNYRKYMYLNLFYKKEKSAGKMRLQGKPECT